MRLIDANALQREYMQFHDGKRSLLVDVAPTIEPERKRGKWIKEDNIYETVTCSVCHGVRRDNRINHINFCNCCGADMRGEEE